MNLQADAHQASKIALTPGIALAPDVDSRSNNVATAARPPIYESQRRTDTALVQPNSQHVVRSEIDVGRDNRSR